jgi:hypothetical protein
MGKQSVPLEELGFSEGVTDILRNRFGMKDSSDFVRFSVAEVERFVPREMLEKVVGHIRELGFAFREEEYYMENGEPVL